MPAKKLLTRKQVADLLGIKVATLEVWASTGRYSLPYVKVGRLARYRECDVEELIERRTRLHTGTTKD